MKNIEFPYEKFNFLSDSIFEDLNPSEQKLLYKNAATKIYRKGELLFKEGNYPTGLYIIKKGKIKKFKTDISGKEHIICVLKKGETLGYQSLLCDEKYSDCASAIEDCSICFIPKADFIKTLEASPVLLKRLLKIVSHESGVLATNVFLFAQKSVKERLALSLILLREKYKKDGQVKPVELSLSREDLAKYVGTARETLGRLLQEFKEEGLIEINGRVIILKNPMELMKIADIF